MKDAVASLVIIGAGQAGAELAFTARQQGWDGPITIIGDEPYPPYQRPPLSKAYLSGTTNADSLTLRSAEAFAKAAIDLRLHTAVRTLDRHAHRLDLDDGSSLEYRKLAICTGGRARPLTCAGLSDEQPLNLRYLRNRDDADQLRQLIGPGKRVVVIGGGYVGLEVAASARKLEADVTLIEAQDRVLSRVTGEPLSRFYEAVHRAAGVHLRTSTGVARLDCDAKGTVVAVVCGDGERVAADVVVAGLGMLPNVEFAEAAGLVVDGGIVVDAHAQTSDPDVFAAGDCTVHHSALYGRVVRLESVPNALEQARAAAFAICGKPKANTSVPWFWSDQYDLKLQMVGLSQGFQSMVLRGDMDARSFIVFYLADDRIIAADAVNRPVDFMLAKKLIGRSLRDDPKTIRALGDPMLPLKDLLASLLAAEGSGRDAESAVLPI